MEPNVEKPGIMDAALVTSVIIGIAIFILSTISTYIIYSGEPSGSIFGVAQIIPTVVCLVAAIGGVFSVRNYATQYPALLIGDGAKIGLLSGLIIALVTVVLGQVWQLLDPGYMEIIKEYTLRNMEMVFANANMSDGDIDKQLGSIAESFDDANTLKGISLAALMSIVTYSIVNLISGVITAKVKGQQPAE